ncbi:HAD family hydrolase [Paenibacillus hamazuiensis]|uniref:HAD family hydrolase n=1 Tax=Paenibacillus hamazuiensis TaxID=2936508 RepID=UPI00200C43A8|nr:HAD family hydrolase [Paenibacillus hamazuiensis]
MTSQPPKAILLDMDDTILAYDHGIDTDGCWITAFRAHLRESDAPVSIGQLMPHLKQFAKWYWSDPDRHRIGRLDLPKARTEIVSAVLSKFQLDDPDIAARVALTYGDERDRAVYVFPDAIETIRRLREKGIKLALLTNGNAKPQRFKVERFGLAELFDCILIEGEFGAGKPDERIYRYALEKLDAKPDETWMIGDNFEWEIAAPQRIGIKGIWVDHKGEGVPERFAQVKPYRIIRTLSEVLSFL